MKTCAFIVLGLFSLSLFAQDEIIRGMDRKGEACSVSLQSQPSLIGFQDQKGMCEFAVKEPDLIALEEARRRGETVTLKGYSNWFDCQVKFVFGDKRKVEKLVLKRWMALNMTFHSSVCFPEN